MHGQSEGADSKLIQVCIYKNKNIKCIWVHYHQKLGDTQLPGAQHYIGFSAGFTILHYAGKVSLSPIVWHYCMERASLFGWRGDLMHLVLCNNAHTVLMLSN